MRKVDYGLIVIGDAAVQITRYKPDGKNSGQLCDLADIAHVQARIAAEATAAGDEPRWLALPGDLPTLTEAGATFGPAVVNRPCRKPAEDHQRAAPAWLAQLVAALHAAGWDPANDDLIEQFDPHTIDVNTARIVASPGRDRWTVADESGATVYDGPSLADAAAAAVAAF